MSTREFFATISWHAATRAHPEHLANLQILFGQPAISRHQTRSLRRQSSRPSANAVFDPTHFRKLLV